MKAQGFKPYSESVALMTPLPDRRAMAWVTLGEFSEPDAYDTSLWSSEDYQAHWRDTAQGCLDGELPTVFCMNYSSEGSTCLPVWPSGNGYVATQIILVPLADLALKGHRLTLANIAPEPHFGASQWTITPEDMVAIANG